MNNRIEQSDATRHGLDLGGLLPMMPPGWKRNGQELAGPCPECGGKDRCFTGAKTKLQFARCRQCNKSFHVGTTFLGEAKTKTKGTGDGPKGPPDRWFDYCRADGRISFQIMRWEAKEGSPKYIRPILPNGDWKLPKGKRVLYNRVDLKRRTDSGVLYVEGEKTAEAAKRLVPERIVTTSAGGADKVDWKPLAKRDIIIWPDFDAPGLAKARKVRAILKDLDATVRVVDLQDSGLPPKWDLADPVPDGVDLQELLKTYIPDDLLAELAAEDIDKAKGGKEVYDDANATNVGKALESLGLGLKTDDRNMTIVYKMPDGSWNLSGASVLRNEIRERCLLNGKGDEYRPFITVGLQRILTHGDVTGLQPIDGFQTVHQGQNPALTPQRTGLSTRLESIPVLPGICLQVDCGPEQFANGIMHNLEFTLCSRQGTELQEFAFQHTCSITDPIDCSYAAS